MTKQNLNPNTGIIDKELIYKRITSNNIRNPINILYIDIFMHHLEGSQ